MFSKKIEVPKGVDATLVMYMSIYHEDGSITSKRVVLPKTKGTRRFCSHNLTDHLPYQNVDLKTTSFQNILQFFGDRLVVEFYLKKERSLKGRRLP